MAAANPTSAAIRRGAIRAGVRIEIVTVAWMVGEAVVSLAAGIAAHSVLLTAFGFDSVIELGSGTILLWRLIIEAQGGTLARVERAESRAAWVTGIALAMLCLYVIAFSLLALLSQARADDSVIGIGVAVIAVIGMPVLARRKRAIAQTIASSALRGDAACSITCAYMAATLLLGLALNAAWGWWWADSLAALGLLRWLIPEAREALEGARAGRAACTCEEDDCDC